MAVTIATIRAHLEFSAITDLSDAVITDAITKATSRYDATVLDTRTDEVIELDVCDQIARSPAGRSLRLVTDAETTIYELRRDKIRESMARAERVEP